MYSMLPLGLLEVGTSRTESGMAYADRFDAARLAWIPGLEGA